MLRIIIIMLTGMALGFTLRSHRIRHIQSLITFLIWALLFLLGVEAGGNEDIIRALPTLGLESLGITLAALTGSLLCACGLWKWLKKKKMVNEYAPLSEGEALTGSDSPAAEESRRKTSNPLTGSLIIVAFFIIGIAAGRLGLISLDPSKSKISYITLCCLMLCVGFSVGNDPDTIRKFRALNPRLALLPLLTIIGTLGACALWSVFVNRSLPECLAIGSGFGYYSLSSIFITEYLGPELGTVALLSNICREILTLTCAPLMVRWFGRLAPISAGGATTMDTTLPVITKCCGGDYVIVSIFHGFIVDFSVPFLVTFFCSL